jgi:hypothetical protein
MTDVSIRYGVVPNYEMSPDGSVKDNTFFYKWTGNGLVSLEKD